MKYCIQILALLLVTAFSACAQSNRQVSIDSTTSRFAPGLSTNTLRSNLVAGTGISFSYGTLGQVTINNAGGTVTSVGLTVPGSILTLNNSPITSSGDIEILLQNQSANRVWAGPTTGAATNPSFRLLVAGDIPDLSAVYQPLDSDLTAWAGTATNQVMRGITNAGNTTYSVIASSNAPTFSLKSFSGSGVTITDQGTNLLFTVGAGSGDVVGPGSATDNALPRFDGTTGKLLQGSGVVVDDSNNITGVNDLTIGGDFTGDNLIATVGLDVQGSTLQVGSGTVLVNGDFGAFGSSTVLGNAVGDVITIQGTLAGTIQGTPTVSLTSVTIDATNDKVWIQDASDSNKLKLATLPAAGSGDVVGPASVTADRLVLFDGTTGKLIKQAGGGISAFGLTLVDDADAAAARATLGIPTYLTNVFNTDQFTLTQGTNVNIKNGALITNATLTGGTFSGSFHVNDLAAAAHSVYVDNNGTISYVASGTLGQFVVGDGSGNMTTVSPGTDGLYLKSDSGSGTGYSWGAPGDVTGPASSVNNRIAVYDGTTGKLLKDGGSTVANVLDRANHTGTQLLSTISDKGTLSDWSLLATNMLRTVTNNFAVKLDTGATDSIDMNLASSTNVLAGALTIAHATNGISGYERTHVRWFWAGGSDRTLAIPSGWKTNVFSAVPANITNGTITKMYVTTIGDTSSSANQTNVFVSFEFYK